jgi:hypothetical protein
LNPVKLTLSVGTMMIYSGVVTSAAVGALTLAHLADGSHPVQETGRFRD